MNSPQSLRALGPQATLEIQWPDGSLNFIPFRELRGLCPCARCVNEVTGHRTFSVDDADAEVKPNQLELVGNYAVRISWSDGHHTGIYTWDWLHRIGNGETD